MEEAASRLFRVRSDAGILRGEKKYQDPGTQQQLTAPEKAPRRVAKEKRA